MLLVHRCTPCTTAVAHPVRTHANLPTCAAWVMPRHTQGMLFEDDGEAEMESAGHSHSSPHPQERSHTSQGMHNILREALDSSGNFMVSC